MTPKISSNVIPQFCTHCEICLNKMTVLTQFPKRGILNQFPGPRLVYLDYYAGHMRNFTGSVDCWGF